VIVADGARTRRAAAIAMVVPLLLATGGVRTCGVGVPEFSECAADPSTPGCAELTTPPLPPPATIGE
jgi:hypothetical protein